MPERITLEFHEDQVGPISNKLVEIQRVARKNGGHVTPHIERRGIPVAGPLEPEIIVAITIGTLAMIKHLSPIIIEWLKVKTAKSVHLKIGETEVKLNGTDNVEKALEIMDQLRAKHGDDESEGGA